MTTWAFKVRWSTVNVFATVIFVATLGLTTWAQVQKPAPAGTEGERRSQRESNEIEKLREEIRLLRDQLDQQRQWILMNLGMPDYLTFAPEVDVQQEDYAEVRSRFRTKLLRRGPAPQNWSPVRPPAGAIEIEYPSGGLRLRAWINRPTDFPRKSPAVLFLHGGNAFYGEAWDQSKPYRDAGFVVLTPMLRGENGLPGAWSFFYDEVDDVLSAADYLSRLPYVDASHLFIAGHSNGGTLTLLAAMTSRRFRAAASFDGSTYRPDFLNKPKSLPFETSDPREKLVRSPMAYATSFKCPVRIYHATESIDLRFGSLRTAALAKMRGLDVAAVEIEGNHDTHVRPAVMQSIAFFHANSTHVDVPRSGDIAALPERVELDLGEGVKLKLVRIEPGKFQMGSPATEVGRNDDEARHEVEIMKPFAIGVYEVTQAQYLRVMGARPSMFSPSATGPHRATVYGLNTDDFPVEGNVSWQEAMDFCRIVSLLPDVRDKGWVVDLPTETEWEYTARSGTDSAFHVGNALSSEQANFNGNYPYGGAAKGPYLQRPSKVGSYAPNAWGIYDMLGNVAEWCKDWYVKDYGRRDEGDSMFRMIRGCAWSSQGRDCRAGRRQPEDPDRSTIAIGFRVVVRLREK